MSNPTSWYGIPLRTRACCWFHSMMLEKLEVNRDKGDDWRECEMGYLVDRLSDEVYELRQALEGNHGRALIVEECADVANFAMMIADKVSHDE